jgi:hypothetical protein
MDPSGDGAWPGQPPDGHATREGGAPGSPRGDAGKKQGPKSEAPAASPVGAGAAAPRPSQGDHQ